MSYRQAMVAAKSTYKKKGSAEVPKRKRRKKKKVKFQTDEKTAEMKQKLGGSIDPKTVKIADVEPTAPALQPQTGREQYLSILKEIASNPALPSQGERLQAMSRDLEDYRPRNLQPFYTFGYWYQRFPEEKVSTNGNQMFSGNGSRHDHHDAVNLFHDTFNGHPELLGLYNGSKRQ